MKRNIYLTLVLMIGLFSSCNDFLNLPPLNNLNSNRQCNSVEFIVS